MPPDDPDRSGQAAQRRQKQDQTLQDGFVGRHGVDLIHRKQRRQAVDRGVQGGNGQPRHETQDRDQREQDVGLEDDQRSLRIEQARRGQRQRQSRRERSREDLSSGVDRGDLLRSLLAFGHAATRPPSGSTSRRRTGSAGYAPAVHIHEDLVLLGVLSEGVLHLLRPRDASARMKQGVPQRRAVGFEDPLAGEDPSRIDLLFRLRHRRAQFRESPDQREYCAETLG